MYLSSNDSFEALSLSLHQEKPNLYGLSIDDVQWNIDDLTLEDFKCIFRNFLANMMGHKSTFVPFKG